MSAMPKLTIRRTQPLASAPLGSRIGSKRKKSRGQTLVEFALVLPVLLLLLMGSIDFGWMLFNYVSLYNGLREGVRYASVGGYDPVAQYYQCDAIRKEITSRALMSGIKPTDITITYDEGITSMPVAGTCAIGTTQNAANIPLKNGYRVVIQINMKVNFITPFIKTFAPQGMIVNLKSGRTLFPAGF